MSFHKEVPQQWPPAALGWHPRREGGGRAICEGAAPRTAFACDSKARRGIQCKGFLWKRELLFGIWGRKHVKRIFVVLILWIDIQNLNAAFLLAWLLPYPSISCLLLIQTKPKSRPSSSSSSSCCYRFVCCSENILCEYFRFVCRGPLALCPAKPSARSSPQPSTTWTVRSKPSHKSTRQSYMFAALAMSFKNS